MELVVANFGFNAGSWRVERHPRFAADVTGDGVADIVGFGDAGVWVARNAGTGSFHPPQLAVTNFGFDAGGWRVGRHPRFLADVTGDGRADIVGFGNAGVWIALSNGDGTFQAPKLAVENFGYDAGGWRVERHPRVLADLLGGGRADIVGFGDAGVWTALSTGGGTFAAPKRVVDNFAYQVGGWRVERHPRVLADATGDGTADIVGFGNAGVWLARNQGNGTFLQARVRRNIWDLQATTPWDPVTLAYAKAVKAMQGRPITDPTSWEYQAAIHGRAGAQPPGSLWNECQHGGWYFLPWHRIYLYYFERIVRAEVIAQGGPADWALPYWDYDNPGQAKLPPAFREATMPDGSANPLLVTDRSPGWNVDRQLPASAVSSTAAMNLTAFTGTANAGGFGGGASSPAHFFSAHGELEFTPHGDVHVQIGGFMLDPDLAALDPIFWLHHCNIDRLWEVWLNRGGGRANPSDTAWLTQAFSMHDETGAQVALTCADVLDTLGSLEYSYQDVAEAMAVSPAEELRVSEAAAAEGEPELVGASDRALELTGTTTSIEVTIDQRALAGRSAEAGAPQRAYLNLEDIEAERTPGAVYEVYVRSGPETGGPSYYVGNVSFFGIEHMSPGGGSADEHGGFRRTFDITAQVAELRARGEWDDQRVDVTLRPVPPIPPTGGFTEAETRELADAAAIPVRIGRVSVFYG
ncbi:MAG TPA: tyrosinase family protein [Pseudonocardia sp.]|nr:tyrosinase family protein [Pseudonocardia sp.]